MKVNSNKFGNCFNFGMIMMMMIRDASERLAESDHDEILFRNRELKLLLLGSGCPLQAGTGHGSSDEQAVFLNFASQSHHK